MISTLDHKPKVFEDTAVTDPIYLENYDDKGVYGYVLLNFNKDKCAVHLSVVRWGHSVLRGLKKDWEQIKDICRERGCTELFAVNPEENAKWYCFLGHFGFKDYTLTRVYHQEV